MVFPLVVVGKVIPLIQGIALQMEIADLKNHKM